MKIKTNNHWRDLIQGYELTARERAEFDTLIYPELDELSFIKYKNELYLVSDFFAVNQNAVCNHVDHALTMWHAYYSDSYFSGIVIRLSDDYEQYQIGSYSV